MSPRSPSRRSHGGAGFTLAETYVVLEELGRALTPSPLLASVTAAAALTDSPLLEQIAAGTVATLAWSGVTGPADAPVGVTFKDGKLTGSVSPVLYGDVAEIILVAAEHDGGVGLFSVDPSTVTRTKVAGLDPTLSFANLDVRRRHRRDDHPGRRISPGRRAPRRHSRRPRRCRSAALSADST